MPLLADPSEEVRRLASYALDQFEALDPRNLPALIAAHRLGLDVAESIARTGSDEALRYIEAGWSDADEPNSTNLALPLFGARAEPFLLRRLERCRQACSRRAAQSLLYALDRIGTMPDEARAVIRDVAAAASTEPDLRREMEDQLIFRAEPPALPIIVHRLGELRGTEYEEWAAADLLERLRPHGEAAIARAGPTILSYLSRRDLRQARLAAVVTAWAIDYRAAVPQLRAVLADADRDWLVAYQALSALAELGGREARPDIARLARRHWYRPVRNSARRALNRLDGGAFELPERRGREERGGYVGELNFAADVEAERDCRFDRAGGPRRFGRDAPVPARGPRRGAVRVALEPPSREALAALGRAPELPPHGALTLDWRRPDGRIVAIDGGRWEGGLFTVGAGGKLRRILAGNVLAVFRMGVNLVVITGVQGTISDEGELWRLPAHGALAMPDGPLRLPARPTDFALTSDRTLLIRTERGDLAVDGRGRLLPPRPCPGQASKR